jgi:hypothetical protein
MSPTMTNKAKMPVLRANPAKKLLTNLGCVSTGIQPWGKAVKISSYTLAFVRYARGVSPISRLKIVQN